MTGDIHEISRALGDLEASVRGLKETQARGNELFDQHCKDDDERHQENMVEMRGIRSEITALRQVIEPLASSVAAMRPVVEGYEATRLRIATLASVGFGILVVVGWIFESGVKWLVALLLSHWH
jgi:hypothetical protein